MIIRLLLIASIALAISGCSRRSPCTVDGSTPLHIRRLDKSLECREDSAAMLTLLEIFSMSRPDTISITDYLNSRAMTVFQPDIDSLLPSLSDTEVCLGHINARLSEYLPKARISSVYGVVNPFNQAIIVADSMVFIGLNHYLGSDYPGYASFDNYIRKRKTPDRIPYDFTEAVIAINYPYIPDPDCAVINRLLYEGALIKAINESVPGSSICNILGYNDTEMLWMKSNESAIWQTLIARDMLYTVDHSIESRLVSPGPATTVISQETPPAAGRFIGFRIIESYLMKHPETTLDHLLSPAFYCSPSALADAGYCP